MIYIRVGHIIINDEGKETEIIDDVGYTKEISETDLKDRVLLKVKEITKYPIKDYYLVACYDEKEFCESDLDVIKNHRKTKYECVLGEVDVYGFTDDHFFETIRKWKLNYLKKHELPDDGTIFGGASKTITIPEETIVIPEHEKRIYIEWKCYGDNWQTSDSEDDRYENY